MARVVGERAQARGRISWKRPPLAVDLDLDLALPLDDGESAARLVVQRQVFAVLAGHPGALPRAAGEDLGRGWEDLDAGCIGRPQRRHRLRQLLQGIDLPQL